MPPSASTPLTVRPAGVPAQFSPRTTWQEPLPLPPEGVYCPVVDDRSGDVGQPETTPGTWQDYINWAIARAGSIKTLAARSGLHRGSLSDWRHGRRTGAVTVGSALAVATAVGDQPENALRAAGHHLSRPVGAPPPPSDRPAPESQDDAPPLADLLRDINTQIDAVLDSGLPWDDQFRAIRELRGEASRWVVLYRRRPTGQAGRDDGALSA